MIKQQLYKPEYVGSTVSTEYFEMPSKLPELRECPCCGGEAVFKSLHAAWVECSVCGLSTPAYTDLDVLASAWNRNVMAKRVKDKDGNAAAILGVDTERNNDGDPDDIEITGGRYAGLSKRDLEEALKLKQSRQEGDPILIKPPKKKPKKQKPKPKKKRPVGRPRKVKGEYAPKYVPTGRPPGRPRKYPKEDDQNDNTEN